MHKNYTPENWEMQYLNLIQEIVDNGTVQYNERTGKKCYFYHGDMMKFDLSSGYFPLLTTKKMAVKAMIGELIGFIRATDNAKDFRDLKCNFWNANANESVHWLENPNRKGEDDLGRIYGVQARNRQSFFEVEPNIRKKPDTQKIPLPTFEEVEVDLSSNESGLVGLTYSSVRSGDFLVIDETRTETSHFKFTVKFLSTGYVKRNIQKIQILKGNVKDPYFPSVCGIAALGIPEDKELAKFLKRTWRDIIYRCYSKKRRMNSPWYYDKNVFVDDRWLLFENFVKDFKKIDRWELKLEFPEKYSLDKDFYASNYYSLKTCVWALKQEQNINSDQGKQFKAISPNGEKYIEAGLGNFCNKHNLCRRSAEMALRSGAKLKGWSFSQVKSKNIYRIRIDDQLAHVVSKIKHNPTDRRMIVDHWNPNELHLMALPPCHMSYTFGIRDGHLDLCMYQRSCDVPLGIPMNIASYALLNLLVARITGLKPGIFTHFMWNIHIYEDQYDQVFEQLKRKPFMPPKIEIDENIKSLEDLETWVTPDNFKLVGYEHHPAIKYEFSE